MAADHAAPVFLRWLDLFCVSWDLWKCFELLRPFAGSQAGVVTQTLLHSFSFGHGRILTTNHNTTTHNLLPLASMSHNFFLDSRTQGQQKMTVCGTPTNAFWQPK